MSKMLEISISDLSQNTTPTVLVGNRRFAYVEDQDDVYEVSLGTYVCSCGIDSCRHLNVALKEFGG